MTNCECDKPGFCLRHGIVKGRGWHKLCKTKDHYFRLWEKGSGPGQRNPDLTLVKDVIIMYGPGSVLQGMLGCKRFIHAKQMDEWGIKKCMENIDTIAQWLTEYADYGKIHAIRLITIAIKRSHPPENFTPD